MKSRQSSDKKYSTSQPPEENLIINFRLELNKYFGLLLLALLSPYAVTHIIAGDLMTSIFPTTIVILAALNSISIIRKKKQIKAFNFFYVIVLVALVIGFFLEGSLITYWHYPFALIILFSVGQKRARIMLLLSIVILVPVAFYTTDTATAARFAATYFMVCVLGDVVVRLMDEAHQQQALLTITDPLTGALNRRSMIYQLKDAAAGCRRGLGTAALLTIDIDHFKNINDTYGHQVGDDTLKAVVGALTQRKRELDKLFRTGGEEFIMLIRNLDKKGSIAFAESLRAAVEQTDITHGQRVTVSIGVADYILDESVDDWIRRADDQMYLAKRHGRNRVSPPHITGVPAEETG
ncbi:MAG: GGDEF domain-containing protein [Pseudomonadales bacterium]|nr:GGDEF domain-containing protein [Pseudomonadales bacterium]